MVHQLGRLVFYNMDDRMLMIETKYHMLRAMRTKCAQPGEKLHVRGCVAPTTTSRLQDDAWILAIPVTNVCIFNKTVLFLSYLVPTSHDTEMPTMYYVVGWR